MAQVFDVAAYILAAAGPMTTMKLQKLCYYAQGWSLAWDEVPLFPEPIGAWASGPVVPALHDKHRGRFNLEPGDIAGDPEALTAEQRDTVDAVLEAYGGLTGHQLSLKTHEEIPWLRAHDRQDTGGADITVSLDDMQEFFSGLAAQQ
ncbi:MAG: DUF4065 domain-containing protein [Bifidobacteriaceae bacterium]|jgi:uncharacterized phage-associated protein|nr:DUF4065 domain-containing protein [Bifidobacteriaceae bacterium]